MLSGIKLDSATAAVKAETEKQVSAGAETTAYDVARAMGYSRPVADQIDSLIWARQLTVTTL